MCGEFSQLRVQVGKQDLAALHIVLAASHDEKDNRSDRWPVRPTSTNFSRACLRTYTMGFHDPF